MEGDVTTISLKAKPEESLMTGVPHKRLILLDAKSLSNEYVCMTGQDSKLTNLWHKRLGHSSNKKLRQLVDGDMAIGLRHFRAQPIDKCQPCIMGK